MSSRPQTEDQQFLEQLIAITPALRNFARGLCHHREMAEDLAQEAMMRGWAARSSFTPGTDFRAWMYVILRNRFYTALRRDRACAARDNAAAERTMATPPPQEDAILVADVASAMRRLPAGQRDVLMMVGADGMSYEETAQAMGCALGTVKSRLARGRQALALAIEGPGMKAMARRVPQHA